MVLVVVSCTTKLDYILAPLGDRKQSRGWKPQTSSLRSSGVAILEISTGHSIFFLGRKFGWKLLMDSCNKNCNPATAIYRVANGNFIWGVRLALPPLVVEWFNKQMSDFLSSLIQTPMNVHHLHVNMKPHVKTTSMAMAVAVLLRLPGLFVKQVSV